MPEDAPVTRATPRLVFFMEITSFFVLGLIPEWWCLLAGSARAQACCLPGVSAAGVSIQRRNKALAFTPPKPKPLEIA